MLEDSINLAIYLRLESGVARKENSSPKRGLSDNCLMEESKIAVDPASSPHLRENLVRVCLVGLSYVISTPGLPFSRLGWLTL